MAIIENGTYAVNSADVGAVCKGSSYAPPPTDTSYWLRVVLKGTGSASSQVWVFPSEGDRDEFYKKLVNAMAQ